MPWPPELIPAISRHGREEQYLFLPIQLKQKTNNNSWGFMYNTKSSILFRHLLGGGGEGGCNSAGSSAGCAGAGGGALVAVGPLGRQPVIFVYFMNQQQLSYN
jgi:hypothetical protein